MSTSFSFCGEACAHGAESRQLLDQHDAVVVEQRNFHDGIAEGRFGLYDAISDGGDRPGQGPGDYLRRTGPSRG